MQARLAAEPAADLGRYHSDVLGLEAQRRTKLPVHEMGHLVRYPQRHPVRVGVDLSRCTIRFHWNDRHALVHVGAACHVLVTELDRFVVDEDLRLVRLVRLEQ